MSFFISASSVAGVWCPEAFARPDMEFGNETSIISARSVGVSARTSQSFSVGPVSPEYAMEHPPRSTMIQNRGRVLSLYTMANGFTPFGNLAMGLSADQFGVQAAVAAFALAGFALAAVLGLGSARVRRL